MIPDDIKAFPSDGKVVIIVMIDFNSHHLGGIIIIINLRERVPNRGSSISSTKGIYIHVKLSTMFVKKSSL